MPSKNVCALVWLDDIERRCDVVGNCWLWKGQLDSRGKPCVWARSHTMRVRPYVFHCLLGKPKRKGWRVIAQCRNEQCVSPTCLRAASQSAEQKREFRQGVRPLRPSKPVVGQSAKLTWRQAEEIRAMRDTPQKDIAAMFGLSQSRVSELLAGKTYKRPAASVFNWRGQ